MPYPGLLPSPTPTPAPTAAQSNLTQINGTAIATNNGPANAGTQRVATASDSPEIALLGALTETPPATDTDASAINGRLQRVAQRVTSLIGLLPGSLGQKTAANSFAVTIASDQVLPLPTGAATETTLDAIKTALQGDRAISAQQFIDSTNTVYLRVLAFNQQTNAYESVALNFNGTAYTPTAPETPLSKSDADTTETVWEITTAGAGYSIGDQVSQFTLISQGPPISVLGVIWYNQNTNAVITAPLSGHRRRIGAVSATEATLSGISNQFGTDGTGIIQPSGGAGLRGWISGVYSVLNGALTNSTGIFARLTDGTRNATIKAASTAPVAADTALVAVISPNQTAIPIDSELPTAVLLADDLALPTTPIVGAANLLYDGTNLDLARSGARQPAQAAAVVLSESVTQTQAAAIAALNTDLLTGTVSGWFDAKLFKSCSIQIVGGAGITAGQIIFEQTNDTTAAAAGNVWAVEEDTSLTPTPIVAAFAIAANAVRMFRAPITARYVRVRVSTAFVGGTVQAIGVFSQAPYNRMVQTVTQSVSGNLNVTVGSQLPAGNNTIGAINELLPTPVIDIASAAITTTTTTATITPAMGGNYTVVFDITAVTGTTPAITFTIEESSDGGTSWYPVYTTPALTAIGRFETPLLVLTGNRLRYTQTVTGTTPSFTRSIRRVQAANANLAAPVTSNHPASGVAPAADIAVQQRMRSLLVNNNTGTTFFLQIHNKSVALAAGDVPLAGQIYRCPAGSTQTIGLSDWGNYGRVHGVQALQRIGLSSTFGTHTALASTAGIALNIEVI